MSQLSQDVSVNVVNNNDLVYYFIATSLLQRHSLFVSWTDDEENKYDILFALPVPVGRPERGYRSGDLIVAISGASCFHFNVAGESHETYYQEKLGVRSEKMTILLNSVRRLLNEQHEKLH